MTNNKIIDKVSNSKKEGGQGQGRERKVWEGERRYEQEKGERYRKGR